MKKNSIIMAVIAPLFFIPATAQQNQKGHNIPKQYNCFVKIESIDGQITEAALSDFNADSVFVTPVEEKYIKAGGKFIKVLNEEPDTVIAVSQIKKFSIKYDPNIICREELAMRIKQLKKKNAGKIAGITFLVAATVALIPIAVVSGGAIDPTLPLYALPNDGGSRAVSVSGTKLSVSKSYKTFHLNGDSGQYVKMVKRLARSKKNPFECSIAKN